MTQWEYLEGVIINSAGLIQVTVINPKEKAGPPKTLNELGKLGWNLIVAITTLDTNETRLVFRRPAK